MSNEDNKTTKGQQENWKSKGNGMGSIFEVEGGRYRGLFTVGRKANGTLIRKSFTGKSKNEVMKLRDNYMASIKNGTYVDESKMTSEEWFLYWLSTFRKNSVSGGTYDHYEDYLIKHVIPCIGHIKLQKLTTEMLMEMYNEMYEHGRLDGKGGLSGSTIKQIHIIVSMALRKAFLMGKISKNPALACELNFKDKVVKKKFYTIEEQKKILKALDTSRGNHLMAYTIMMTGLRRGEASALTWDDIDFDNLLINVNKSVSTHKNRNKGATNKTVREIKDPKTPSSIRTVPMTKDLARLLKDHKQKMIAANLAAGRSNKNHNFVFQTRNGLPQDGSNVTKYWNKILAKAGVDHVVLHGTRHSLVTRLAEQNIHPKVAQRNLGHKTMTTTMDIYTQVSKDMVDTARGAIANVFSLEDDTSVNNDITPNDDSIKEEITPYIAI